MTSYVTLAAGVKPNPRPEFSPLSERSSAGLNDQYQGPIFWSTMGRISSVHVSVENARRW